MKLDTLKKIAVVSLSAAILNLLAAALFILTLPEQVPTQFDAKMVCTSYGSRWLGLMFPAFLPVILGLSFLFYSHSKNRDKNLHVLKLVALLITAIILITGWFVLFLMQNPVQLGEVLGKQFWWLFPVLYGAVMLLIGNYLPTTRQNLMLGYRTPWTLKNAQCWKLTHQFAGKLAVITGLITLIAGIVMKAAQVENEKLYVGISVVSLVIVVFAPLFYSFFHRND